jgi:adenylate kinase family enzyme
MKRLILILNGKGGVGKSTFATHLVQFYKDLGAAHCCVDTDNENSTLKRFHPDAEFVDLSATRGLDLLFELLEQTNTVITDCRAASTDLILGYFAEVSIFEVLDSLGARLTVVMPVNHEPDSLEQLRVISRALENRCDYVVVRNQVHSDQFFLYDKSRIRARLTGELGAQEITMPRLYDWLVTGLSERNLTITAALVPGEFTLIDRQRLLNWWRTTKSQIESAGPFLLPAAVSQSASSSIELAPGQSKENTR